MNRFHRATRVLALALVAVLPLAAPAQVKIGVTLSTTGPAVGRTPSAALPRGPATGPYTATPRLRR